MHDGGYSTTQGPSEEVDLLSLWTLETNLLTSLMYRNKNQHGRTGYWKRLEVRRVGISSMCQVMLGLTHTINQEVRRRTEELDVPSLLDLLVEERQHLFMAKGSTQTRKEKPRRQLHQVPATRSAALSTAILQCCSAMTSITAAAELLVQEIAQGYFLNLLILFLAILGRFRTLLRHLCVQIVASRDASFLAEDSLEGWEGKDGEKSGERHQLFAREVMRILEKEANVTLSGVKRPRQNRKESAGSDRDQEDDLGVALSLQSSVACSTSGAAGIITRIIPPRSGASKALVARSKSGAASRAMLASEYSSSSEEGEENKELEDGKNCALTALRDGQDENEGLQTIVAHKMNQKKEQECRAVSFVIDRIPDSHQPDSSKKNLPAANKRKRLFKCKASYSSLAGSPISQKKSKQEAPHSSGASLIRAIDDIFNAAGAKKGGSEYQSKTRIHQRTHSKKMK